MEGEQEFNIEGKAVGVWVLSCQPIYIGTDDHFQPMYRNSVVMAFHSYRFPEIRWDYSDN